MLYSNTDLQEKLEKVNLYLPDDKLKLEQKPNSKYEKFKITDSSGKVNISQFKTNAKIWHMLDGIEKVLELIS